MNEKLHKSKQNKCDRKLNNQVNCQ